MLETTVSDLQLLSLSFTLLNSKTAKNIENDISPMATISTNSIQLCFNTEDRPANWVLFSSAHEANQNHYNYTVNYVHFTIKPCKQN